MVDQPLERLARLDAVVELKAGGSGVVTALRVAVPLAIFERWKLVDRTIEIVD